jgi:aromatic ring-opening dioxygenase catalytic subunit (LigB family)
VSIPEQTKPQPAFYIPHGAGPCFFMEWTRGPRDTWDKTGAWLKSISQTLDHMPDAILIISAHWEEQELKVTGAASPGLIYDYYGFPPHTYELKYPAPGKPELAGEIAALLNGAGFKCEIDPERGFDHGVFIPLKLMFPEANIPVVQLSLKSNLDAAEHIAIGKALAPLRQQNILIIGSGMSFHNPGGFKDPSAFGPVSEAFDTWLNAALTEVDSENRLANLKDWQKAPQALANHPREEHLIPLIVAAGSAAGEKAVKVFADNMGGIALSGFAFGE